MNEALPDRSAVLLRLGFESPQLRPLTSQTRSSTDE
jgi:hypothetical protein